MAPLRQLTLGFGSGAFGACIMILAAYALSRLGVPERLGITLPPASLYLAIVWGAVWGFLLAVPVLNRAWWLKGILIGVIATAALVMYLTPDLRGILPTPSLYLLLLHIVWGIAAGLWWAAVSGPRKTERRYGSFIR